MTADETGEYLRISNSAVCELVRGKGLPGHKAGREWRLEAGKSDERLESAGLAAPEDEDTGVKSRTV